MKYFRSYPYLLQWLLLLLLWFTSLYMVQVIVPNLFTKITGFTIAQLSGINPASPAALVNAGMVVEGIGNLMIFAMAAFLFAYLTHPRPAEYLGLRAPILRTQLVLVVFIMIGAMPVLLLLQSLVSQINFGPEVKKVQAENENMMNAFLNITTAGGMLKTLLLLALIPAFGEELFFRGVLMKLVRKRTLSMSTPVIATAFLFAFSHTDIYGLPSIFLAGVLLAVIYNLTGSLWCSILAHFCFNGATILLSYGYINNRAVKAAIDNSTASAIWVVAGALVFSISFYLLLKNKTPLPAAWTDDFAPREPKDDDWDFMPKS